jgi:16S rRNA (guanine966-N2)-methyltransferase
MDTLAKKLNIKSQVKIINANAMALNFESINESYDLIFLDPPFNQGLVKKALDIISKYNLLKERGCLYIECEKDLDLESISTDFSKLKESKSGEAKYYLYAS